MEPVDGALSPGPVARPDPGIEPRVDSSIGATQSTNSTPATPKQDSGPTAGGLHPITGDGVARHGE